MPSSSAPNMVNEFLHQHCVEEIDSENVSGIIFKAHN